MAVCARDGSIAAGVSGSYLPGRGVGTWTEFATTIKHVLHRSKEGNALVAKLIIAKRDDEATGLIQLGRFAKNYEGSKYMISCTKEEAEWIVNAIPALLKNARAAKVEKDAQVLDQKEFENERSLELRVSKFRNFKQIDFVQTFLKDDTTTSRTVSVPVSGMGKVSLAMKQLLVAMQLKLNAEQRLTDTEHVFVSYLAYLVKTNIDKSLTDPRFTVPLDDELMARINDGTAPMAYWFTIKYLAANFQDFKPMLLDIFKVLDIKHFDEARFKEQNLLRAFNEHVEEIRNPDDKYLFDFTMFLIENLQAV